MRSTDSLGDRIKAYEKTSQFRLLPKSPVFIRIDGRAFHTFTRGCDKPFDQTLIDAMVYATQRTAREISGFKLAYVQSDEATFMLTDTDTHETQGWFDYELNKLVSISASTFTTYFNSYWSNYKVGARGFISTDASTKMAVFDSRAFTVPIEDAPNAFIWRQRDWERNSVQMLGRSLYSHKELQDKKLLEIKDMSLDKGYDWESLNDQLKYGTWVNQDYSLGYEKLDYNGVNEKIKTKDILLQKLETNTIKMVELQLADDKLKNVYSEDWLSYRDDRLKELNSERDAICESISQYGGEDLVVYRGQQESVDTLSSDRESDRGKRPDSRESGSPEN